MHTPTQIAKHLREVYFGNNWTAVNLKDTISDVNWEIATQQLYDLNTIATLVYHMTYYVVEVTKVLEGGPLEMKDELSFSYPAITSQEDWEKMLDKVWADVEHFAQLVEAMPEEKLGEHITDKKYDIYYRYLHGIIEHAHYHLGQILLIKKIILL
ncbi:MAG: DUF1572 domain-containing protein [Chitinophagales bacterium]|nr:DUF1572 domain-containing protein [Chitinophagales bacterium]